MLARQSQAAAEECAALAVPEVYSCVSRNVKFKIVIIIIIIIIIFFF
jgi:hypothetical protein